MTAARDTRVWVAVIAAGALVATVGMYVHLAAALVALPVLIAGLTFVVRPALLLPLLWFALLLSDGIPAPINFGVPLTLGKGAAVGMMLVWLVHAGLTRTPMVKANALSAAMLATVVMLTLGLAQSRGLAGSSLEPYIGTTSLFVLGHVIWTVARPTDLWWVLRVSAWLFAAVVPLGLLFGGAIDESGGQRNTGFGGNPNVWAMTLVVGLGPALAVFAGESWRVLRWAGPGLVALVLVALLATVSRAGILVFVLVSPLSFALMWRQRVVVLAAVAAFVIAFPFLVDPELLTQRFASFFDETELEMDGSVRDRALLQGYALQAFLDNPVFGLGTASFVSEVRYLSGGTQDTIAHNAYLQLLAENGIVGGVIYAVMYGVLGWMLWDTWKRAYSDRIRTLAVGFFLSYCGFFLTNLADNGFEHAPSYYVLGLAVALYHAARMPPDVLEAAGFGEPRAPQPTTPAADHRVTEPPRQLQPAAK